MAQSDLRLTGDVEPRNATARLRGGPQRPAEPGSLMSRSDLPRKPALSSSGKLLFLARAELCLTCVTSLQRAFSPKGDACLLFNHCCRSPGPLGLGCGAFVVRSRHRARLALTGFP